MSMWIEIPNTCYGDCLNCLANMHRIRQHLFCMILLIWAYITSHQAVKLHQACHGDQHPITLQTLDLFTLIYAEMGKQQYKGKH